jgi:hypothetical protein
MQILTIGFPVWRTLPPLPGMLYRRSMQFDAHVYGLLSPGCSPWPASCLVTSSLRRVSRLRRVRGDGADAHVLGELLDVLLLLL